MKKLHLLILRSFFGPFFLIFFIVLFVLLMQFLWRYINELVGKGLEFNVIAEFLLYTSATLVPMALPLSILMSSLMTFGNLGERYELSAIKSSGISLQRIMSPLIILVVFISIGAFFFANNVLPYANLQMRSLLYDIQQQRPELQIKSGVFSNLIDNYSIRVEKKDPVTNTLYGVQIYNHTDGNGNVSVTVADSGTMIMTDDEKNLILTLHHGRSYNELQEKQHTPNPSYPHRYEEFEQQKIIISLSGFSLERTDQDLFKNHYAMMNLEQLGDKEDSLKSEIIEKQEQLYVNLVKGNFFKKHDRPSSNIQPVKEYQEDLKLRRSSGKKNIIQETSTHKIKQDSNLPKKETASVKIDTVKTINVDSIYNLLTLRDKDRILTTAVTYARTSKNIVSNSMQTVDFKIRYLRRFEIEWHRKFTIAFACLVFLFIGAPLGAIIRKGGLGLPLVLSVLFFIFYYILSLTGDKLVRESVMPAYQGMWLSSAVFFVIGMFLTYKATTDSTMLNLDTYVNFIKKYLGQRYTIIDKLEVKPVALADHEAKVSNIKASLIRLQDNVYEVSAWKKSNSNISDVIFQIFALSTSPTLIQFERYYNNTFRIILSNKVFENKSVRSKISEFPSFNSDEFIDKNWKLILRIILACIPPLTLLVLFRHFIKMLLLESKLKKIKQLIPELVSILNITYPDISNENSSSM